MEGSGLPDADAPTASVVSWWTEHQSAQIAIAVIGSFAAVLLVWFGGTLRGAMSVFFVAAASLLMVRGRGPARLTLTRAQRAGA